jgi:putative FmdB family regulatory protein
MPIFEFECSECRQHFEKLVRSSNAVEEVTCPACGGGQVRKKMSTFASKLSGGSQIAFNPSASSCSSGSV